ncbi:MAG: hypothetical protein OEY50_03605 [Nitrospinota bacterium]|nr:hypothetical protein [Nitrospinota bacterium]MDH5677525.1 hypothetical protein [Nitrospinota bacterium]
MPGKMESMGKALKVVMALAAIACAGSYTPASAQTPDSEIKSHASASRSDLEKASPAANPEFAQALRNWAESMNDGDHEKSVEYSGKILERHVYLGSRNIIPAADIAITVGRKSLAIFDFEGALMAGQLATQLAPDYPVGYFFLGKTRYVMDKKDVNNIFPHYINGVKATLLNKLELARFVSGFIKFIFISVAFTFIIVFVTLLFVHHKALFSEVISLIPGGAEDKFKYIIGALLVLAPLALGGLFLFVVVLSLLLWPYIRKNEKGIIILFVALVLVAPTAFKQMAKFTVIGGDDTYRALYLLSKESWDYESKMVIERALAKNPNSELFLFATGSLNKMAKNTEAAVAAYDALLAIRANNIEALINKGNAIFQSESLKDKKDQNFDEASGIFEQATKLNPNSVEAFYNLNVAYTEMLQNKKATKAYESALNINQKKANEYAYISAQNSDRPEKKVIDFLITPAILKTYENTIQDRVDSLAEGFWGANFAPLSLDLYKKLSMAYVLLFIGIALFWERGRIPHQTCLSCGAAFHPPMRLEMSTPKCNQCVAAQSSKTVVTSVKKDLKKKEIREYKDRVSTIADLLDRVIPGVGRIYTNSPFGGMVFTAISTILVVFVATLVYYDLVTVSMAPADMARKNAPAFVVLGLYWLTMNTALFKEH